MSFKTILIPVDFSINTEVAVKKALEICEGPGTCIHLLHVRDAAAASKFSFYGYLTRSSIDENLELPEDIREKLEKWLLFIQQAGNDIRAYCWVGYESSIERAILTKTKSLSPDLIVIGKNSQHSRLPFLNTVVPSRIATKTGVPVLTVKPGAMSNSLRTVVVPIGSTFPETKVAIINSLSKKFFVHIRLLILVEKEDDPDLLQTSLLNICRVLKHRSFNNISYEVMQANHKGADILKYCQKVKADLLIVHPDSETKIGWMNKHISDELPVDSKTQVLTVCQGNFSIT